MNVPLKPEIEKFIEREATSGRYGSAAEVVEAGIARLMIDAKKDRTDDELEDLRAEIAIGLQQSAAGQSEDWDIADIRAEGKRLLDESKKKAG